MIDSAATWLLLRDLRRGARRPATALREMQGRLLSVAVHHAHREVPFYRRVWGEAGVTPSDIRDIADLQRLPILAAEQVRAAIESGELLSTGASPNLAHLSTSGSSGAPLRVPRGATEARLWRAGGLRMLFEHGYSWRDSTVQFDPPPRRTHVLQRLGVARTTWVAPELPLDQQIAALGAARAEFVVGSPTVLRRICRGLEERRIDPPRPRAVFCQGEILDRDSRDAIRHCFGIEPVDAYGATEVGYIGWQCDQRTVLHVNAELLGVELLVDNRAARAGELARVVVTDLRGRTMPLLRWDTGDLALVPHAPCPCGRTLPVIGVIEGRARQSMQLAGGRVVTARTVVDAVAGTLGIADYGLRQDGPGSFTLQVAPECAASQRDAALARLRGLLGDVEFRLELGARPRGVEKTHVVSRLRPAGAPLPALPRKPEPRP